MVEHPSTRHLIALALYPTFLGMAPVLGKLALNGQADPFTIAALRTVAAAAILWTIYLVFWRKYIFIYPAGLLGCVIVGTVNGIGSLFYYNGLNYLDASVAQLLNSTYLIFVVVLAAADGHKLTQRTVLRAFLAFVAVVLITQGVQRQFNWFGVALMIGNAILFAGMFILSQRVLYEMPAQTVALYVLTTMAVVVVIARLIVSREFTPMDNQTLNAILALGVTTALARLTMFFSVKRMGSLQTVLVGISETAVAILLAFVLLGEQLLATQWLGVGILLISLLLIRREDIRSRETGEMLPVPISGIGFPSISFQRAAFTRAFLGDQAMKKLSERNDLTPEEAEMIRQLIDSPRS
ncbi:MAG: DMT family transporter [Anaerolineae bacterium]|nr:DMT family transporter [Anaerolineae bacterium]